MMGSAVIAGRYDARRGERVGDLTFWGVADERGDNGRLLGVFHCVCGNVVLLRPRLALDEKKRTHCGCKRDFGSHRRHGMRNSREYSSWMSMKMRCLDPKNKDYHRWGGRGITVCQEWIDTFEAFYAHIGPRPKGTSLDRIDNLRGYDPGNVRWATLSEQQRNRRRAYEWHIKGRVFQTVDEAAEHFRVSTHTVWRWVNGQFDKRRNSHTERKEGCYVVPRY